MATEPVKVALLIETAREFGRQLLHGVANYAHEHGPWAFLFSPGDFRQAVPKMRDWGGDAIIARLADRKTAEAIAELDLPTIIIGLDDWPEATGSAPSRLGRIEGDSASVARLVADHLFDNRLKRFAYVGLPNAGFSHERQQAFAACLREASHDLTIYAPPASPQAQKWEREYPRMARWIAGLPKPIGIMACNDDRGREVLEACALAGVRVPEDVTVIGVDNDSILCDLATPPLSSVEFNAEAGGYAAATLLDRMLKGESTGGTIVINPLRVVPRRSTDAIAVEDQDVASALLCIRSSQGRGVSVEEIVDRSALPRRTLELRFRKETGRSILEEIQHARLSHAKQLLATSNHSIAAIAELSGYSSTSYLSQVFRKAFACTPAGFRKSARNIQLASSQ